MQDSIPQDEAIRSSLTKINDILVGSIKQLSSSEQPPVSRADLEVEALELEARLKLFPGDEFSYEFYRNASDVIETITELRLAKPTRKLILDSDINDLFKRIATVIRTAVFRHPTLAQEKLPTISVTKNNSLQQAREVANQLTEYAATATTAAEKANELAMQYAQQLEQQQKSGEIDGDLLNTSLEQTVTIFLKNTAAVLATEAATTALLELEAMLDRNNPR